MESKPTDALVGLMKVMEDEAHAKALRETSLSGKAIESLYSYFNLRRGREEIQSIDMVENIMGFIDKGDKEAIVSYVQEEIRKRL